MKVLIADDHPLLVDGLCSLLAAHDIEVVATVGDGHAAVDEALRLKPDLVLMDISMPVMDGLAATRLIKAQAPEMRILILTTSAEDKSLFEAIKSGACGYLLKITRGPDLIDAMRGIEQGIPPFSPGLAGRLLREFASPSLEEKTDKPRTSLSDRQEGILHLVSEGYTYKEIGLKLSLSEATVRYHMGEVMRLLHLKNRSQVIAYAAQHGL